VTRKAETIESMTRAHCCPDGCMYPGCNHARTALGKARMSAALSVVRAIVFEEVDQVAAHYCTQEAIEFANQFKAALIERLGKGEPHEKR